MANTNKVTIASTLRFVIDNCTDKLSAEMLDKLNSMLAQTEKKSANRKSKATSDEDKALMEVIKSCLSAEGKSVTDIRNSHGDLMPLSTPKLTSLLGKLIVNGEAERFSDKRKTLFRLA